MIRITSTITISRDEINFTFARSPGPGGQNVNKVNSKAILRWDVTRSASLSEVVRRRFLEMWRSRITKGGELVIHSHRHRDQKKNADDCLKRLQAMVRAAAVVPKSRKATRPTYAAKKRRLESKKRQSQRKQNRRPVQGD
jgi:ribosome-associated protein